MELQKIYVRNNFNKASSSYDNVAFIQRECSHKLVNILKNYVPSFYPHSILDLGTGTGYIPEILLKIFPKSKYTLNDIAPNMLAKTKENLAEYKEISFVLGDMEVQNFNFHNLIISNLALQWASNFRKIVKKSYENSDIFAFSCLLDGTFNEWSKIFTTLSLPIPTYQYPSQQELESYVLSLKPKKYFFDSQEFTLEFSNSREFARYLKNLGANQGHQSILLSDLKKIFRLYASKINISYKIFFGILGKCKFL